MCSEFSVSTSGTGNSSESRNTNKEIMARNMFSNAYTDLELLPLVDLWLDLAEHIQPDAIPSPAELYKERDEVVRYDTYC